MVCPQLAGCGLKLIGFSFVCPAWQTATSVPFFAVQYQNMNAKFDSSHDSDKTFLGEFGSLWAEAHDLWERHQDTPSFHGYVSADYLAVYESLARLRGRVSTVLEWGSGLGIVTIMASRMGFEAYGIEAEAGLIAYSQNLAQVYGPKARFAQGSFIPDDFVWSPADADDVDRTILDAASAYDELDMDLRDFDLIYAYPWPNEYTLYRNIMREFARKDALLLSYDAREGIELVHFHGR